MVESIENLTVEALMRHIPWEVRHGMPVVEWYALGETMGERLFAQFADWMGGQTMLGPIDGKDYVYRWDVEQFFAGLGPLD